MSTTDITKEEKKVYGIMSMTAVINYERKQNQSKTDLLLDIIERLGDEPVLREAYKAIQHSICVKYEARRGTKLKKDRKTGEDIEYDCYLSVYNKYAGSIKSKLIPLCNGYIKYNDTDFDYDKVNKKFVYKHESVVLNNFKVKVVK